MRRLLLVAEHSNRVGDHRHEKSDHIRRRHNPILLRNRGVLLAVQVPPLGAVSAVRIHGGTAEIKPLLWWCRRYIREDRRPEGRGWLVSVALAEESKLEGGSALPL